MPCGLFDVNLNVEQGIIRAVRMFGDYFGRKDVGEFERALIGVRHDYMAIANVLDKMVLSDYFVGLSKEQLLSLLVS